VAVLAVLHIVIRAFNEEIDFSSFEEGIRTLFSNPSLAPTEEDKPS